jgi:tRNA threonylcarbamoyl adenosine modification protein (Sua5/YciO/YrdC/YwlC family)
MILKVDPRNPQRRHLRRAASTLEEGGLVVYATDTLYGLGCDIFNKKGMERALAMKGRTKFHNLSFLCSDLTDIARYAHVSTPAYKIMRRCLPGAYTFILPATREVPKLALTRQKTVGIRIPDHPVALGLVSEFGRPITSTSVTTPDGEILGDPEEIEKKLGHTIDLILDSGPIVGEPSTVVDLTGDEPQIVRLGRGDPALIL